MKRRQLFNIIKPSFLSTVSILSICATVIIMPFEPESVAQGYFGESLVGFTLDTILFLMSSIMYFFLIFIMGKFATVATQLVVMAAFFDGFTTMPAIKEAWAVVRDLSNMMFIVILLLIAFGTLFRIEAYSWKKLLPKMVLAAILMNYSRAIVGAVVDASQIVMLTFAEAIAAAADQGISKAFGLGKLLQFSDTKDLDSQADANTADSKQRLLGIAAAGLMLSTLVVVQLVYATVLIGRVVMIWFLTVLSPLAFAMMVLPATEKYYKQWTEMLSRYVTVGPMMLFYLWLAMFIASKATNDGGIASEQTHKLDSIKSSGETKYDVSGALDTTVITNFIIATMMLLAGLKMAQDNASEMGSITSKASSVGKWVASAPLKYGAKPAASYLNDRMFEKTGMDLNLSRVAGRWKEGLDKNRRNRELAGGRKASEKYRSGNILAGVLGAGDEMAEKGLSMDQARGGFMGQVPILGGMMNRAGWALNKEAFYRRALDNETEKKEDHSAKEKALADEEAKFGENNITEADYAAQELALNAAAKSAAALTAGGTFDMKNDDDRAVLEGRLAQLQTDMANPATTATAKTDIAKEMAYIQATMKKSGPQTLVDGAGGMDVTGALGVLVADRTKAHGDFTAKYGPGGSGTKHADEAALEAALKIHTGTLQTAVDKAAKDLEEATKRRDKFRSRGSLAGESKQRALIQEARKNITSNDSSELSGQFMTALEDGRGADALALLERLAETNNYNDALGALQNSKKFNPTGDKSKFAFGYSGVQDLQKVLREQTGMSDQAVMSSIHYSGQQAKNFGATPLTELTELVDNNIVFRSLERATQIGLAELSKMDGLKLGRTQGRMAWGDGAGDKNISHNEVNFLRSKAQRMMVEADTRGHTQMVDHGFQNLTSSPIRLKVYVDEAFRKHGTTVASEQLKKLFGDHGTAVPDFQAILKADLRTMLAAAGKDVSKGTAERGFADWL